MRPIARLLLVMLAVSACEHTMAARQEAAPPECVAHVADLPAVATSNTAKHKQKPLPFARHARCLRHDDGSAEPLVLFAIDQTPPFEIRATIDNRKGKILAARIEALDANFERIAAYPFDAFTRRGGLYAMSVFSNDANRPIRYLLVGIDPDAVGRTDQRLTSGAAVFPLPGGAYSHAYESALQSEMSDTGWIGIAVTALADAP